MDTEARYIHDEEAHNLNDPRIILPLVVEILKPKNVVDIGCGIGTFLKVFKELGVEEVLGLDGPWVNKNLLRKYIADNEFQQVNLEQGFTLGKKYDLLVCLEVLEHLDEKYADTVVESLTKAGKYILFSAAVPGQMGQNHLNEQWIEYWSDKFEAKGYKTYDVLRPIFWNNKELARWYKQNMFLLTEEKNATAVEQFKKLSDNSLKNLIHPEYYNLRVNEIKALQMQSQSLAKELTQLKQGKMTFKNYLKLNAKYLRNIFSSK